MKKKQKFGQFFTTNVDHILNGFEDFITGKSVLDPFAGNGDLLKWAKRNGAKTITGFDVDQKCIDNKTTIQNDSLKSIPLKDQWIITNPPYLAKNKMSMSSKKYLLNSNVEDLYLLAIQKIIDTDCAGGIIIVPVNFFSAENSDKTRTRFLDKYRLERVNYFTNQVFDDTTYNVVAFSFTKNDTDDVREAKFFVFPEKQELTFILYKKHNYRIGGIDLDEILRCDNSLAFKRLTDETIKKSSGKKELEAFYADYNTIKKFGIDDRLLHSIEKSIIILECIDTKNGSKIRAVDKRFRKSMCLVGKNTSRSMAFIISDNISIDDQSKLIQAFNMKLNGLRKKYNSLFLTNFRDNNRKRISFDFCYKLLNWCYFDMLKNQSPDVIGKKFAVLRP